MLLILVTKEGLVSYPAVRWHHVTTNRMSAVCYNITAVLCCAHQSSRLPPNAKRTATPRRAALATLGMRTVFCRLSDYFLRGK